MDDKEKLEQHLETLLKENKITSRELVEMSEKLKKRYPGLPHVCDYYGYAVDIGWYAFEGHRFSPDPNAYPNLQGVVAWLSRNLHAEPGEQGLIITPDKITKPWGDYCPPYNSLDDGKQNTLSMLKDVKKRAESMSYFGKDLPIALWCAKYCKNGVKPGEGFMPAIHQLEAIVDNSYRVNDALKRINGALIGGTIWSSSETGQRAYCIKTGWLRTGPTIESESKWIDYHVRCVIAF